ncbi:cysteine protease LapG [Citrobacter freundii]|uniref:cysteine protease LapG n=1 Tax=Citrobacter freundii TaxID=546 RepID=UPI003A8AF9BE
MISRCLRRRLLRLWKIPGALLLLLSTHSLRAAWDFANILQKSDALYGPSTPEAQQRINAWQQLLIQLHKADEQTQLRAVNQFFNDKIRYAEDIDVWHNVDYWATPIESLRKGEADCEDYAIAKYFTLRQLGVSEDKLRITYVKALRYNRAHMVLTWYATPEAIPLVLDSLTSTISPATQRMDLLPVYSFNNNGLWLPGNQNNQRVGDSKRLSRWQQVFTKMREEGFPMDK